MHSSKFNLNWTRVPRNPMFGVEPEQSGQHSLHGSSTDSVPHCPFTGLDLGALKRFCILGFLGLWVGLFSSRNHYLIHCFDFSFSENSTAI